MTQQEWEKMSPEEKKKELYYKQVEMLKKFLENGAITQKQFDKSYGDLTIKMGIKDEWTS